jgi:hypothetical protein
MNFFFSGKRKSILSSPTITIGLVLSLILIAGIAYCVYRGNSTVPITNPETIIIQEGPGFGTDKNSSIDPLPQELLKPLIALSVPFTPQAPTANWDELHNEACEEASAIMAYAYFSGMTNNTLAPTFVESEIEKLTKWQQETFGYYLDITSVETARMIEEVYGLNTGLIANFTEQQIKQALSENKLVLISTNGRLLGNPNYKQPGPIHHMLVVTGYDEDGFITNDPGTRKGLNYRYDFQTLQKAAADWDHTAHTTDTAIKIAILVSK